MPDCTCHMFPARACWHYSTPRPEAQPTRDQQFICQADACDSTECEEVTGAYRCVACGLRTDAGEGREVLR
jgi:hypothetical protein